MEYTISRAEVDKGNIMVCDVCMGAAIKEEGKPMRTASGEVITELVQHDDSLECKTCGKAWLIVNPEPVNLTEVA